VELKTRGEKRKGNEKKFQLTNKKKSYLVVGASSGSNSSNRKVLDNKFC
jgi:hypothetical protein